MFQACSNRIPYSGILSIQQRKLCFKPVRTGFPIRGVDFENNEFIVSSLFEQDSLFGNAFSLAQVKVSSLFEQDSLFGPLGTRGGMIVSSLFEQDSLFG